MARLTESQLAGFRVQVAKSPDHATGRPREREKTPQRAGAEQPPLALADASETATSSPLGPVPSAPSRSEPRHKIGLTLPTELADQIRALTRQGYALGDLVMVAYQHHRDELLGECRSRTVRRLQRRSVGRSSFTVTLSAAERDALDVLARHLDTTRSQAVAALLERHVRATDGTGTATTTSPRSPQ